MPRHSSRKFVVPRIAASAAKLPGVGPGSRLASQARTGAMKYCILLAALTTTPAAAAINTASNYIRLERTAAALELQTASVTLSLEDDTGRAFELGLLSTVHLAEKPYYQALQSEAGEAGGYDRVLFELLVDESLVATDASGARRLKKPLEPAPGLATLAARNQLATQVGSLDCAADERWVLADVSSAELRAKEADAGLTEMFADAPARLKLIAPLRSLLSSGPPKDSSTFQLSPLRLLLSCLPAPEAALLLDDWVSSGGATPAPVLLALAGALSRLEWGVASRLSFAQTLAGGESTQQGSLAGALVRWRNARAVEEVDRALDAGCGKVALLYGALHMRDLRAKLQDKYRLVGVSEPRWSTAWSIPLPQEEAAAAIESGSDPRSVDASLGSARVALRSLLAPLLAVLCLLAVDASDWISVLGELILSLPSDALTASLDAAAGIPFVDPADATPGSVGSAIAAVVLYLGRHALLYLALERWAFQWDARWWAVTSGRE